MLPVQDDAETPPPVGITFDEEAEKTRVARPAPGSLPFRAFPSTFGEGYKGPPHINRFLKKKNPFCFDTSMVFHEEPHLYVCENGRTVATASVSGLIKRFKEEFNSEFMAGKVVSSRDHPKLQYAVNPILVPEADYAYLDPSERVIVHDPVTDDHVYTGVFGEVQRIAPHYTVYTFTRGMTYEEIKASWDSPVAANKGTEAHLAMELFFNGEAVFRSPELETGLVFAREVMVKRGIVAFRCEFEIYAVEEDVAGSVDFLAKNQTDDRFHIFDWKRAKPKKLEVIFDNKKGKLKEPFKHIVATDVPVYCFQLSAYMFVIEKYLKLKIDSLALVSLWPDRPWHTFCPYLRFETEYLMQQRRLEVAKRITALLVRPTVPVCEVSGLLAFDAVATEDGRIFNFKDHRINASLPPATKDCPAARAARSAALTALRSVKPLKVSQEEKNLAACKRDFRDYMGPEGVQDFTPCRSF